MAKIRLTEKALKSLPSPVDDAQAYFWDHEVRGFGVVVGRDGSRGTGARTFIVRGRVAGSGERVKVKIGGWQEPRDDQQFWTVELARERARAVLGQLAAGSNPNAARDEDGRPVGPTLREGVQTHLARMKKKNRSPRSIQTFEHETTKYLADWLDRPIAELTGAKLVELHQQIKERAAKRTGTNPANEKGAPLANRVIAHVSASWRSLNKRLEGKLGSWNPASAVDKDTIRPKRERILDENLPDYAARVATMRSPIKRDGLMVALYTGLRHEDVRTLRFEFVDFDEQTMHLPNPKGGESKAFTIPLSKTPFATLQRRQRENAKDLGRGDEGWCFPGIDQDGKVGPVAELRAVVTMRKNGKRVAEGRFPVEDVHSLRRTWESIANDEGITELDQHVLSNHSFGSHNVERDLHQPAHRSPRDVRGEDRRGHHAPHPGHAPSQAEGEAAPRGAVAWRRSSKARRLDRAERDRSSCMHGGTRSGDHRYRRRELPPSRGSAGPGSQAVTPPEAQGLIRPVQIPAEVRAERPRRRRRGSGTRERDERDNGLALTGR